MKTFLIKGKTQGVFVEYTRYAASEPAAKVIGRELGLKAIKVKELKND